MHNHIFFVMKIYYTRMQTIQIDLRDVWRRDA